MKTTLFKIFLFATTIFVSPVTQATVVSVTCDIAEVAQMDMGLSTSRIHIKCVTPINDNGASIYFFSLPTSVSSSVAGVSSLPLHSYDTANFLDIGKTAIASNKQMKFYFVSGDTSGSKYGCATSNCRKPVSFIIYP